MPIDYDPHPEGTVIPVEGGTLPGTIRAHVLTRDELAAHTGDRWRAHWETCPNADQHRRRRPARCPDCGRADGVHRWTCSASTPAAAVDAVRAVFDAEEIS